MKENQNSNAKQIWEILADHIIVIMSLIAENISVLPEREGEVYRGECPEGSWTTV